jgi:hypothetical protein
VVGVNNIMHNRWKWGSQILFIKSWHVDFDARNACVDILPIWVHILGLPLVLWFDDVFEAIGNALRSYYEVDYSF